MEQQIKEKLEAYVVANSGNDFEDIVQKISSDINAILDEQAKEKSAK